jgi:periplasmic protein CpxP/Spy
MDTTQTPQPSTTGQDKPRRRFIRRMAIATAIAGLATGIGIKAFAHGHGGWHRGGFMGAAIDPAMMDEHLDRMLKHLYVEIDATDAQKQQLAPIVKSAARDLLPMRSQFHDARRQAVDLLSRERVDRAALEALRADQLRLADQASVRFTQALADIADVLTPAQRKQLAERIGRWHGRRG